MSVSRLLAVILRVAMYLSLALLLVGVVGVLLQPPAPLHAPGDYLHALRAGRPLGVLAAGLAVLTLGPLCGVAATAVAYLRRRDHLLAIVALATLLLTLGTLWVNMHR
jgi:uncharacterized membrane protein